MKKRIIVILSMVFALVLLFSISSILLYPLNKMHTTERINEFRFTGLATKILIDDNPDFTTPKIVEKPFIIDLEPGKYYWKTNLLSNKREFTIDSMISINLLEKENKTYTIQNKGNTIIGLLIRNIKDWTITGEAVLDVNEETDIELEDNSAVEASESSKADITGKIISNIGYKNLARERFLIVLIVILSLITFMNIILPNLKSKT